ncbi:MAG: hypothetical protein FWD06_04155 [Oscillospiraceae bacterium]|nr:hypothetical protein [Oscillospiraceae bacterium]
MNLGQRIMVFGSSGSGKSTMARRIGEATGLPVVHMDTIWWEPGWVSRPRDEVYAMHAAAIAEPAWVFDGNYSSTRDERMQRADTVIFLDFNRFTCLCRVLKRRVMFHGKTRPDLTEGCPEKIDLAFLKFVWVHFPRKRPGVLTWLAEIPPHKQVFHLKGRCAVKRFLAGLEE